MRSSSLERTRCSKEAHFWVEPGSQQIYQLGGVLHDFSGLPAASGRWIPGLPTGDGSAALEPPCEGKKNWEVYSEEEGVGEVSTAATSLATESMISLVCDSSGGVSKSE